MPVPLYQRGVDSVKEFECAAAERFIEAELLHKRSRDLAAIYLWGYAVEMRVKAAFFRSAGFAPPQAISRTDRADHAALARTLGLLNPPGPHEISVWAQLAVAARATTAAPYPTAL